MKTKDEAMRLANELDAYHTAPHHKQAAMLVRKVQMNAVTATPHAELLAELMNPNNPKNEREHAAVREIERLCEALAQPAQEPVAWMYPCIGKGRMYAEELDDPTGWQPLYTTPPAAQPVGQAPCVRHCESTAYEIVIRGLKGDIERLKAAQRKPLPLVWLPDLTDADRKSYQAGHDAGVAHHKHATKHKQATKRPWVDLTEQEALDCFSPNPVTHSKNVEDMLKEKNT
jgi:hypothetical protein